MGIEMLLGSASLALGKRVASVLNLVPLDTRVSRFSDGELNVQVDDGVRGQDVVVLQSTSAPVNDHLMMLLMMADAAHRAGAKSVVAVVPYYGYARQDRIIRDGTAVSALSAKLVADLLRAGHIDRVVSVDLHCCQLEGFFDMPVINLNPVQRFVDSVVKDNFSDLIVVAPDVGAVARSRIFASKLTETVGYNVPVAIVDKHRQEAGVSEVMTVIGDVVSKNCLIVDDIVDSAGTLCNAAAALKKRGALSVRSYVTHGVLSGKACTKISESELDSLVVTDSISCPASVEKIRVVSVADLIAQYLLSLMRG